MGQQRTPDATPRARQAVHSAGVTLPRSPVKEVKEAPKEPASPGLAEERARSHSLSAPAQTTRKRTSSGVFQLPAQEAKEAVTEPSPSFKERARSNSLSAHAQTTRKRTSSGVFQVDESEPPPKKPESARSPSENARKRPEVNGRKDLKKDKQEKKEDSGQAKKEKKVIERFDTESDAQCVSAFKESDSWD